MRQILAIFVANLTLVAALRAEPLELAVPPCDVAPQTFTLPQLEQLASANNPTIAAAAAQVQQEEGLLRQVGLYPNPSVGYLRSDADQTGQGRTQGVFVSQDIVTAGKLRLNRDIERQDVQWRLWQLQAQRERVLNDVRIRYFEVLGAQQMMATSAEFVRIAEEGVKAAQRLLKAKQGAQTDVLQAEIQLNAVQISHEDARARHEAAWRHLANVIGIPQLQPVPLIGNLENNLPDLNWEQELARLVEENPVLQAQQAKIREAQASLRRARVEPIPNLTVQVVAERDYIQNFSNVSTLVALPLPLFNRNQGNIQSAQATVYHEQSELDRLQLAFRDQLAATYRLYRSTRFHVDRIQKEILPRAQKNLDLTDKAYKAGQFDFQRVLTAREMYYSASLAYLDSLTELHKVAIEVSGLLLTGGLNPSEIGTALQSQPAGGGGLRSVLLQQLQEQNNSGSRLLPGAIQGGGR